MAMSKKNLEKWNAFEAKVFAFADKVRPIWLWIYRLRGLIFSIPIAAAAVIIALYNQVVLPDMVGLNMQSTGEFAMMIGKGFAVIGPLVITGVCLLLIYCSRRILYPWLISLFSLALPLVILFTNTFPG